MIRFRTIEPGAPETPVAKAATPAPVPAIAEAPDAKEVPAAKGKGLTRKTPLRAKKPDAARLFRD